MKIGDLIKQFRSEQNISVNRLADMSGISQSYLRDLELNKKIPTVKTLSMIHVSLLFNLEPK